MPWPVRLRAKGVRNLVSRAARLTGQIERSQPDIVPREHPRTQGFKGFSGPARGLPECRGSQQCADPSVQHQVVPNRRAGQNRLVHTGVNRHESSQHDLGLKMAKCRFGRHGAHSCAWGCLQVGGLHVDTSHSHRSRQFAAAGTDFQNRTVSGKPAQDRRKRIDKFLTDGEEASCVGALSEPARALLGRGDTLSPAGKAGGRLVRDPARIDCQFWSAHVRHWAHNG